MNCKICGRELGAVNIDEHHWIPKTFGGRETDTLHRICHRKIHSMFTERELQHYYFTPDRILAHTDMQKFVSWVQKKPLDFYDGSKETRQRNGKRRR